MKVQYGIKITECRIKTGRHENIIMTKLGDKEIVNLFAYNPKEIQFTADEFIGLTVFDAWDLFYERDLKYIRNSLVRPVCEGTEEKCFS